MKYVIIPPPAVCFTPADDLSKDLRKKTPRREGERRIRQNDEEPMNSDKIDPIAEAQKLMANRKTIDERIVAGQEKKYADIKDAQQRLDQMQKPEVQKPDGFFVKIEAMVKTNVSDLFPGFERCPS